MSEETVNWLVQEIQDLLDVSSVGLYEFMCMLNTPDQRLSDAERKSQAEKALRRLLAEPGVELVQLRWPDWTRTSKLTFDELPADPWREPDDDGLYVALDRVE
jgi:hypothetical protein